MCSIDITCDSDRKRSSNVIVFNLMTTRWTCAQSSSVVFNLMPTSVCAINITCGSDGKHSSSAIVLRI